MDALGRADWLAVFTEGQDKHCMFWVNQPETVKERKKEREKERKKERVKENVNECEETNGGCEGSCCNTIGSYYCKCPSGLQLQEDGTSCQVLMLVHKDINDWMDGGPEGHLIPVPGKH
ncbi:hypothetical protein ACEWY4_000181 [Coilia grayii]|uniref:EGF-like calcium-binding domain-containing protein n=1 Tax=Coilia grayii TaxID=363190 RepID=A0ABD1KVW7_9TELE